MDGITRAEFEILDHLNDCGGTASRDEFVAARSRCLSETEGAPGPVYQKRMDGFFLY